MQTQINKNGFDKSKAIVNTEVNSGNRKAVLPSNYATRIRGCHAALQECIMYKVICNLITHVPFGTRSNAKVDVYVLLVVLRGCQSTKTASSFYSKNLRIFFSSSHVLAELNLIHVNDFGCLARDLNLAVFSMVIFLSTFKRTLLSAFITSEEASNLAKVAILGLSKRT